MQDTLDTLLCATDFSDASTVAVEAAIELVRRGEARRLHLLHVTRLAGCVRTVDAEVQQPDGECRELLADFVRYVASVRARLADVPGVEVVHEVRWGDPTSEIVCAALDVRPVAVVLGTHGRRGIGRVLLGSVAEQVVRYAPCTVIVARPPRPAAPVHPPEPLWEPPAEPPREPAATSRPAPSRWTTEPSGGLRARAR